jgi:glycosyltransferase involved in cell wall biosynthesis
VSSVLDQVFTADDFEVIVVNDSGHPLPEADWQNSKQVRVINTQRRERCVARNTGAAIANGKYLHFLDDDDWILPGALQSFWELAQREGDAGWLYGSSQLVNRKGEALIQLHHHMSDNCFIQVMAGEWIPLQSSCIKAETFFTIGGFLPLLRATQDVDLSRRIALHYEMANTSNIVACIEMGIKGSTTDYKHASIYSRWAREKILNEPGVFARMRGSAYTATWRGRMMRIYFTSALWNLQHHRGFIATSRILFGLMSLILAGHRVFSPYFWRAAVTSYQSETFLNGFRAINRPLERRES